MTASAATLPGSGGKDQKELIQTNSKQGLSPEKKRANAISELKQNFNLWVEYAFPAHHVEKSLSLKALDANKTDKENHLIIFLVAQHLVEQSCQNRKTYGANPEKALAQLEAFKELLASANLICDYSQVPVPNLSVIYQFQQYLLELLNHRTQGYDPVLSIDFDAERVERNEQLSGELILFAARTASYFILRECFVPGMQELHAEVVKLNRDIDSKTCDDTYLKQVQDCIGTHLKVFGQEQGKSEVNWLSIWNSLNSESYYVFCYSLRNDVSKIRHDLIDQIALSKEDVARSRLTEALKKLNNCLGIPERLLLDKAALNLEDFEIHKPSHQTASTWQRVTSVYNLYRRLIPVPSFVSSVVSSTAAPKPFNLDVYLDDLLKKKELEHKAEFTKDSKTKLKDFLCPANGFDPTGRDSMAEFEKRLLRALKVEELGVHQLTTFAASAKHRVLVLDFNILKQPSNGLVRVGPRRTAGN